MNSANLLDWHAIDKGCIVHAVFLDVAKAFDSVDYGILLRILESAGVGASC